MRNVFVSFMLSSVFLFSTAFVQAQANSRVFDTKTGKVKVEKMASGMDTPWAMAMLPDGRLLVTERDGRMMLVDVNNGGGLTKIDGVPKVWARGQGGLLDVVLDPGFAQNRTIYFTFSHQEFLGGAGTAIASAKLNSGTKPKLEDVNILFSMDGKNSSGLHFGSRIVPDGKGNLFFTIGDRGREDRAQDPFDAAGSVLRIKTDGSVPGDNPFADGKAGLPQIWSIGHRNPQGATLSAGGELWTLAHGAAGGDEINRPERGKNYGWPIISYGTHYSGAKIGIGTRGDGYEQPVYFWDPSIAPSGMDFYDGNLIPQWKGNLFVGALKFQRVSRLVVEGGKIVSEEPLFEGEYGRVRDVRSFPDGALWFLTNDGEGSIYRVTASE